MWGGARKHRRLFAQVDASPDQLKPSSRPQLPVHVCLSTILSLVGGTRPLGVATSVFWGWRHVEDADQSAAAAPPPPKSDAGINTSRVWAEPEAEIWGLLQQPRLYTQPGTRIAAATDARCAAAACWLTQVVSEPQTNVILRDYSRGHRGNRGRIFDLGT